MQVTVTPDRARGTVRVSWTVESGEVPAGSVVVGHRPTVIIAGHPIGWRMGEEPWLTFPWSIVAAGVDAELGLEVVVDLDDGGSVGPFRADWTLPPFFSVVPTPEWDLGPPTMVADHGSRVTAGLSTWPDGTIGLASVGGAVVGFAANGGDGHHPAGVARWRVDDEGGLGLVLGARVPIEGEDAAYAAGGPVWQDPATGHLLMLYHGELHPDGDTALFWSFVGLAASVDGGARWITTGRIIEPGLPSDAPRVIFTEVGGAPFVIRPEAGVDHMLVYFRDTLPDGSMLNMGVARAPVAAVAEAARTGRAPEFRKWHAGGWTEPGRGGASTDLMSGSPTARWFDVVHLADRNEVVMVQSDGFTSDWGYLIRTSPDGVSWSAPHRLGTVTSGSEQLYLSLVAPGGRPQRSVAGAALDLYRVRSQHSGAHRWDDAVLERLRLTRRPSPAT